MAELAKENLSLSVNALITRDYVNKDKVAENEARINHTYHAIARYLIKLASLSLSESDEKLIGAYHHVISDIERIGDHSENFLEQARKWKKRTWIFPKRLWRNWPRCIIRWIICSI